MSETATSADGTAIAFDRSGTGPTVVLVHGAMTGKAHPIMREVADALSPWFTVVNYDRRGRGDSRDAAHYAVEREVDDLATLIAEVGGSAMVFGGSSGAALALTAAAQLPEITKVAVWEPPFHVDDTAPGLPRDFEVQLRRLVEDGRRGDAVEMFMTEAASVTAEGVAAMRADPGWAESEAIAHTLVYEAAVMGPGNELPVERLARVAQPVLVMNGDAGLPWMAAAARATAQALPSAAHRVLAGQRHAVSATALAPELLEFFSA